MKKQNKLSIEVRDLEPLKDVTGGKHRRHRHAREAQDRTINPLVGEYKGGLGPFGENLIP
jgi:hypothetical protein